ncbi:TATA box-binding protein-like 1 [Limanda limanda]|uniref:TATA box-binding protein-like 1 n=1 Tax=Limanda limanda TaxID=27771 RepID=UPI0029C7AD56|nr:TATA box-binding protein-like 1 [Limanda limanda]
MDSSNETIDINVTNVVSTFSTLCPLILRTIALNGYNVKNKPEAGQVQMRIRKPKITASIWSSGKIMCTGAKSEDESKRGARRVARSLQKLGFKVRFSAFRVVNVLAVCRMPFAINLIDFTKNNSPDVSYEPELHPAAKYRIKEIKATVQVFSTGSITITGPNVKSVVKGVEKVYPLLFKCKMKKQEDTITGLGSSFNVRLIYPKCPKERYKYFVTIRYYKIYCTQENLFP